MKPAKIAFAIPGIARVGSAVVQAKISISFTLQHSAYPLGEHAATKLAIKRMALAQGLSCPHG